MARRRDGAWKPLAQSTGPGVNGKASMANREKGEVSLEVQGVTYTLRPTFNASCELETLTNTPYVQFLTNALAGRFDAMRALMWCFLQEYHASEIRTLKDAAHWIERAGGLDVISAALQQVQGVNAPEGDGAGNPQTDQNGTGANGTGGNATSPPVATISRRTSSGRSRRANTTAN